MQTSEKYVAGNGVDGGGGVHALTLTSLSLSAAPLFYCLKQ